MCIGNIPNELNSKTRAIQYAISLATNVDKNSKFTIDLVLATGIYNFITERVDLPDTYKNPIDEAYPPLMESLKKLLDKLEQKVDI